MQAGVFLASLVARPERRTETRVPRHPSSLTHRKSVGVAKAALGDGCRAHLDFHALVCM